MAYSYHIDNKEEIDMSAVIVKDLYSDEVEVSTASARGIEIENGHREGGVVKLHIDPNGFISEAPDILRYSPAQARQLAAALILAAEEAEEQVCKSTPKYNGDPCHNTMDSILAELPVGHGKTVESDYPAVD